MGERAAGRRSLKSELSDLRAILRDIQSQRRRVALLSRLAVTRLGRDGGWSANRFGGSIRLPFPGFEADFELSQGEITPYAQMLRDVDEGVIPRGADTTDWTVVDCGANVGLFSLFLGAAGRVIVIEPNPDTCQRLQRNMDLNDVNATLVQAAVSSSDTTVRMNFAGPSVLAEIGEKGVEVPARRLDSVFSALGVDQIDLLKLDVERHEIPALEGASETLSRRRVKCIVAEHNREAGTLAALDQHLLPYGFRRRATGQVNARFDLG